MLKFVKDIIFGEPVVAITILSFVLTSWLAALTQLGEEIPLWLAIAAPAMIALGGFYAQINTTADNAHVHRLDLAAETTDVADSGNGQS